eukprot:scaffold30828_cov32-Prasinocladus_malaysianus.AAC.1
MKLGLLPLQLYPAWLSVFPSLRPSKPKGHSSILWPYCHLALPPNTNKAKYVFTALFVSQAVTAGFLEVMSTGFVFSLSPTTAKAGGRAKTAAAATSEQISKVRGTLCPS